MVTYSYGLDLLTCRSAARSASSLSLSRTFYGNNFFIASSAVNSAGCFFRLGMEVS